MIVLRALSSTSTTLVETGRRIQRRSYCRVPDEYYDGWYDRCEKCADVCRQATNFCRINCPVFYEQIYGTSSTSGGQVTSLPYTLESTQWTSRSDSTGTETTVQLVSSSHVQTSNNDVKIANSSTTLIVVSASVAVTVAVLILLLIVFWLLLRLHWRRHLATDNSEQSTESCDLTQTTITDSQQYTRVENELKYSAEKRFEPRVANGCQNSSSLQHSSVTSPDLIKPFSAEETHTLLPS